MAAVAAPPTKRERALAAQLDDLTRAYLPAMAVFAAVELELFDALIEPVTIDELAARIGVTRDGLARLCHGLGVLGLVAFDGDRVRAVPEARAVLGRHGACSIADTIHHHHRQLMPPLLELAAAVRTGQPQHAAWPFARSPVATSPYDELARHPREMAVLVAAMDHDATGVGDLIAHSVALHDAKLVVDLGCGGGAIARELMTACPDLRVASFDQGAAVEVARARSVAAGFADRHFVAAHDARLPLPAVVAGADAVLLSGILADFPVDERLAILRAARATLRPGGCAIVAETLLEADRSGPPKAALLSVLTLAITRGDQLTVAQLADELALAGFDPPVVTRGAPRDLVVATASHITEELTA